MTNYIIITNRKYHPDWVELHPDLLISFLDANKPQRTYFPFWSWRVPNEVFENYECIGFHTGEKPGGSPIQHLIRKGETESIIRAFHITSKMDKGETVATRAISLYGSLEEILLRASRAIMEMIDAEENHE